MPQAHMPVVRHGHLQVTTAAPIALDSEDWFTWLITATHFCFWFSPLYRLTVRKEKRRHQEYWYAYLKYDRKLHNAYVGRSAALTTQHLEDVAQRLVRKVSQQRATASA